jgi:cation:H+ antiporter
MTETLEALGIWGNLAVLVVAAAIILVAGSKLERWADAIGNATALGKVFAGMLLLAVATSLPEVATSITAALRGESALAVNNLIGGVIFQTMVLAIADVVGRRAALTSSVPSIGLLWQGVTLTCVLATTIIAAALETHYRDTAWVADVGAAAIALVAVLSMYLTMKARTHPRWMPANADGEPATSAEDEEGENDAPQEADLRGLWLRFAAGSAAVCAAGFVVVLTTEQIASSTGASQSFLGFTLVAFVTSLPELSTTLTANRRGHGVTAVSNVFGSNTFDVALLLLVALCSEGALFADALIPTVFSASLGIVLTVIYMMGMFERRDRTVLRMGWDSAAVLVLGMLGVLAMYALGAG